MISSKDLNKELDYLDKLADNNSNIATDMKIVIFKAILKSLTLIVKLIRDMRSNQTKIMKEHYNLNLTKDNTTEG